MAQPMEPERVIPTKRHMHNKTKSQLTRATRILALIATWPHAAPAQTSPTPPPPHHLTVEYADSPIGLDEPHPRFAWQAAPAKSKHPQSAYQIQVAPSEPDLLRTTNLTWDSGRVPSPDRIQIPYTGKPLASRKTYTWRVKTWIGSTGGPWSHPAKWEMGQLAPSDWNAQWIGGRTTLDHNWRDATFTWNLTLIGPGIDLLFRARPIGKTYGEAYVWRLRREKQGLTLTEAVRHYAGGNSSAVIDSILKSVPLHVASNAPLSISVRASGPHLVTSINGNEVETLDDSTVPSGTAGVIGMTDPSAPFAATLHKLEVTEGTRTLFSEDFARNHNALTGGTMTSDGLAILNAGSPFSPVRDIVVPIGTPAPLLRHEFSLPNRPVRARLYVAAGGFVKLRVNGTAIGHSAMENDLTAYDKRVLYRTYDLTSQLHAGVNVFAFELGRGRYGITTPNEWYWQMAPWHANPAVRAQLIADYADGHSETISTGPSWRTIDGPTLVDSLYAGETYDARLLPRNWQQAGFDDSTWAPAQVVDGPTGELHAENLEAIAVIDRLRPVSVREVKPGIWVFDFGRIFAGWLHATLTGNAGDTVSMMQGEKLLKDGTVEPASGLVDAQLQVDRYILAGTGHEEWEPSFSYKGFRYVQVQGLSAAASAGMLTGLVAHSNLKTTGVFESSDELLNAIQRAAVNSLSNNMHGLQSDTPTYEKNGWTGDAQASSLAAILNFGVGPFWTKTMADARDAQSAKGEVPEIVPTTPFYGYENTPGWNQTWGPTPSWDAFTFVLPDELYHQYGDRRILEQMYSTQRRLVDYTGSYINAANGFTYTHNLGEYAAIEPAPSMSQLPPKADGSAPTMEETITYFMTHRPVGAAGPVDATAVAYFYYMVKTLAGTETLLGKSEDAAQHRQLAAQIRTEYNRRYWNEAQGRYRSLDASGQEREYSETQNALPVAFGMEPDGKAAQIVQGINSDILKRKYHLSAGVYGIRYLLTMLSDYGYTDTVYAVATQTDEPSWGWWIKNDLQTMLEGWSLTSRSWDHHYFAEISSWFYQSLAGIRPSAPGYASILIAPHVPKGLQSVKATLTTVQGPVTSAWRRTPTGAIRFNVTIPEGTSARIEIPAPFQALVATPKCATKLAEGEVSTSFRMLSGNCTFEANALTGHSR